MEKEDLVELNDLTRDLINEVSELRTEAQRQSAALETVVGYLEKIEGKLEGS